MYDAVCMERDALASEYTLQGKINELHAVYMEDMFDGMREAHEKFEERLRNSLGSALSSVVM